MWNNTVLHWLKLLTYIRNKTLFNIIKKKGKFLFETGALKIRHKKSFQIFCLYLQAR
jgi:hypothetical protein